MSEIDSHSSAFGPHLTLDLAQCNPDKLNDLQFIYNVLDQLPNQIGMTKLIPPYVFPYSGVVPEDKGITGVVIIAESHISIHTFTEKNYAFVDIFSCKHFDHKAAKRYLIQSFESKHPHTHIHFRGVHFPRQLAIVA